ncbi:alpha/beta fold hydrolase [Salininema proteolyticum]|uniref:Alpha/beta fold hydrolase n=1 Tax=Salininema proteolyticum TaxID=1607685 RepID=A0ABV8U6B1_9ACTN
MKNIHYSVPVTGAPPFPVRARMDGFGPRLVLLVHGFGCAGDSFAPFHDDARWREDYTVCSFDLPGHGGAPSAGRSAHDQLSLYAEITAGLARTLRFDEVHLVAHSMGGAVGLLAASSIPGLASFTSIEGNLVGEDCGLVSRNTASQSLRDYVREGHSDFLASLSASAAPDLRAWSEWYGRAAPAVLHSAARSMVAWCDSGELVPLWESLPRPTYVYGERTGFPEHGAGKRLYRSAVEIPGSGHFAMVDAPETLNKALWTVLESARNPEGTAAGR